MQKTASRIISTLAIVGICGATVPAYSEPAPEVSPLAAVQSVAPKFVAQFIRNRRKRRRSHVYEPLTFSADFPENGNGTIDIHTDYGIGSTEYGIALPETRSAGVAEDADSMVSYATDRVSALLPQLVTMAQWASGP